MELLLVQCCLKVVLICGCDQNNEAACVLKLLEVYFMTFALCGCEFPKLQIPQGYSQNRRSSSECINTGQTAESHWVMLNIFSLDTKHQFQAFFFPSSCFIIVDGFVLPCCFVLSLLSPQLKFCTMPPHRATNERPLLSQTLPLTRSYLPLAFERGKIIKRVPLN